MKAHLRMFGETIDYRFLKLLAHGRNRATEEELDRGARQSTITLDQALAYAQKVLTFYFRGLVPTSKVGSI